MALVIVANSGEIETAYNGLSPVVNRRRRNCEGRANRLGLRGLPNTLAHSPIHGEAHVLRDALPDPEKQRCPPLRNNR
ncbi:hypothetical protein BN77_3172 [Rhizobium mesoamericanum STM3625]|uniref:Uncharacterized protein n=1 Tax=Rhizobium mesoamericanum STM3625 TaxID=1211777 RepID=K0PWK1_9HYPH|nr:hypothetical protein BN77_3172 [Rhizobium mesoamericanum STM3625]